MPCYICVTFFSGALTGRPVAELRVFEVIPTPLAFLF